MEEAADNAGRNLPVTAIQALGDAKGKVNRGAKAMVAPTAATHSSLTPLKAR